jgi:hypothetical protein
MTRVFRPLETQTLQRTLKPTQADSAVVFKRCFSDKFFLLLYTFCELAVCEGVHMHIQLFFTSKEPT